MNTQAAMRSVDAGDAHDDLDRAIEELARSAGTSAAPSAQTPTPPPVGLRARVAASTPVSADSIGSLMASGGKLFDQHVVKMRDREQQSELDRATLVAGYTAKLRALEHEAKEALRTFERARTNQLADDERILTALSSIRDA